MDNLDDRLKAFARQSLESLGFAEPYFSDHETTLAKQFGTQPSGADTAWRWFNAGLMSISRAGSLGATQLRTLANINRAMAAFRELEGKRDPHLLAEAEKLERFADQLDSSN